MSNALFEKYPLVKKAFNEADMACQFLGGGALPNGVHNFLQDVCAILDQNIDRPDGEKEALMVGAILAVSPPIIFDEQYRFAKDYSPEVQTIVNELTGLNRLTPVDAFSTNLSQIGLAVSTTSFQTMVTALKSGKETAESLKEPLDEIRQSGQVAEKEGKLLPNLNAPKLEALYLQTKQEILDLIDAPAMPQSDAPSQKRKGPPARPRGIDL